MDLDESGVTQAGQDFASFLLANPWEELSPELRQEARKVLVSKRSGDSFDILSGWLIFRL